jgi:hypothetical protein
VGEFLEEGCVNPTFICDHPQLMSPLAKWCVLHLLSRADAAAGNENQASGTAGVVMLPGGVRHVRLATQLQDIVSHIVCTL